MESVAKFEEEMAGTWIGGKALNGLLKFIDAHRRRGCQHEEGFEAFEREVRKRFSEAEREFIGEELERLDVTLPEVVINYARLRAQGRICRSSLRPPLQNPGDPTHETIRPALDQRWRPRHS